ncbi:hypothetical protein Poli38472_012727 [Pythium oligandrum]|uniref:FYVE-type domain-containing protein n=1 Tax=Pythium oligandrum TaxID=41045 RepID=A0A8K1CDR3_PYTOL|nr:hypothetical protein Poli38472_012727 [Pythium oligandrum]|eukprot:TMW61536.1 hypothetical protein Poli38472_012727 [Pythium oligandrum]
MVRSLPLRSGFFPTPQISAAEELELLSWGRSLIPDLHHPEAEWNVVQEKRGLQISEDRQKGGLTYSVRAVALVRATLDDLMDMFVATSTQEFRSCMQMQLREYYADSAVLFHKELNETENLSIKWVAMRNKKTGMNLSQLCADFCLMEYAGVVGADVIGGNPEHPIGVCLYESIEQMECPPLFDSHRLERGSISKCGYLFRPREEGIIEVQFVSSIRQPPNQRSKRRFNRALLLNWAEAISVIDETLSARRISRELMVRRSPNWVNDKDRHCCHLCLKTFTNTRRKHHCRACGEIICRNCSMYKSVDLQSVGLTTLRVCRACMDGTNKLAEKEATTTAAGGSTAEVPLPKGVNDEKLRDAVEEYALALPGQQISTVPDLVGIAWLRQVAQRDPSKKDMVSQLMERLRIDEDGHGADKSQVDIYDTLCDLAAQTLACKFAVVSLIDENRQWFKSAVNVKESEVPRDFSFCEYPVRDRRPLVVMDATRDPRFQHNPFVAGPLGVRFLAGAPLFTVDNQCVGAVCVMDTEPRQALPENQIATMQNLAHLAMVMVQERREAQARMAKTASSSQLVASSRGPHMMPPAHYAPSHHGGNYASDMVPLNGYPHHPHDMAVVPQQRAHMHQQPPRTEDPVLKEQMIQLLQKASQVRDQVTMQSTKNAQHPGLQSSAE